MPRLSSWASWGALLALLGAAWSPPAGAEVRVVEATGAVALYPDARPRRPPRDAAMRRALAGAVWRTATEELRDFDPERDGPALSAALGDEPLDFATRFRIVEDRGPRPALFTDEPGVEEEYVVVVQAHVDVDRVRQRLRERGLLARPSGDARHRRVYVVIEEVTSYGSYRAVKTLLDELGVDQAVPVELERGRAVLAVDGSRSADQLLRALLRSAPPGLSLVPLESHEGTVRLQARFAGAAAPPAGGGKIDTSERNRY